jgi:hypothetical protein
MKITARHLRSQPDQIFVYGDNTLRRGKKGASTLRDEPNTYGFITQKYPNNRDGSFYKPDEYDTVYQEEITKLKKKIEASPTKTFLIAKLGSQLANRFKTFEEIIQPRIKEDLKNYKNVQFLW